MTMDKMIHCPELTPDTKAMIDKHVRASYEYLVEYGRLRSPAELQTGRAANEMSVIAHYAGVYDQHEMNFPLSNEETQRMRDMAVSHRLWDRKDEMRKYLLSLD